jgi:hypothetical protein
MASKLKLVDMVNELLMTKRNATDVSVSLNVPEHKFKKHADKMNWVLSEVYSKNKAYGVHMYHIILSLQDFFDMYWLIENVIDDTNKKIIEQEMSQEYGITKEMVKNRKPLCVRKPSEDVECDDDDNDELDDFDD